MKRSPLVNARAIRDMIDAARVGLVECDPSDPVAGFSRQFCDHLDRQAYQLERYFLSTERPPVKRSGWPWFVVGFVLGTAAGLLF